MTIETYGEVVDAELIPTEAEVAASVSRAVESLNNFWDEVKWQVENKAWEVLGYESFNDMWDATYAALEVGIARAQRPEIVKALRSAGQTQQEIADKLGVTERTVRSDISTGNISGSATITNSRGQARPASYAKKVAPNAPEVKEKKDEEEVRTPNGRYKAGDVVTISDPGGANSIIIVQPDGRVGCSQPRVQEAVEFARRNPAMTVRDAVAESGIPVKATSLAYGALRKAGEIPQASSGHPEKTMAQMFDIIAIGLKNTATMIDKYLDKVDEADADDFDYYWDDFKSSVSKINKFRKEIRDVHGLK